MALKNPPNLLQFLLPHPILQFQPSGLFRPGPPLHPPKPMWVKDRRLKMGIWGLTVPQAPWPRRVE